MTKTEKIYPVDTETARTAVERLDAMTVGDSFEDPLIPYLPVKVNWRLIEHIDGEPEEWVLNGTLLGIPFYIFKIILEDGKRMSYTFITKEEVVNAS